jgi:hypothetical protein
VVNLLTNQALVLVPYRTFSPFSSCRLSGSNLQLFAASSQSSIARRQRRKSGEAGMSCLLSQLSSLCPRSSGWSFMNTSSPTVRFKSRVAGKVIRKIFNNQSHFPLLSEFTSDPLRGSSSIPQPSLCVLVDNELAWHGSSPKHRTYESLFLMRQLLLNSWSSVDSFNDHIEFFPGLKVVKVQYMDIVCSSSMTRPIPQAGKPFGSFLFQWV